MATYTELYSLASNSTLRNRLTAACLVAAHGVMLEDAATANHANRLEWARSAFASPDAMGEKMLRAALAANAAATVAQITGVTDAVLLDVVQSAINLFAGEV